MDLAAKFLAIEETLEKNYTGPFVFRYNPVTGTVPIVRRRIVSSIARTDNVKGM